MKLPTVILFLLIGAFATAQAPLSNAAKAADHVFKAVCDGVANRSDTPGDERTFNRKGRHIVLLYDTSQNTVNESYRQFLQSFSVELLKRFGVARKNAGNADGDRHCVSLYPYQLVLEESKEYTSVRVPLSQQTMLDISNKIPLETLKTHDYLGRGHDHSKSRSRLISVIEAMKDGRDPVIIQVTSITKNQDPDHPENDSRIRSADAKLEGLDGTRFSLFAGGEQKELTNSPGQNIPASDVYVWIYGIEKYSSAKAAPASKPKQAVAATGSGFPLVPVLFVVVPVCAFLAYMFFPRRVTVAVKSTDARTQIGAGHKITLGFGTFEARQFKLSMPASVAGTIPPNGAIGEITMNRFGKLTIAPALGHRLKVNQTEVLRAPLDPLSAYRFEKSGSQSTTDIRFEVTK